MKKVIAMGKIAADGSILKATPGIKVSTKIVPGNIYRPGEDIGYTVTLTDRLVKNNNYIVQLTSETYGEDGPDYVFTTIGLRYQSVKKFEVIIWADRSQTLLSAKNNTIVPVRTNWHFRLYDIPCQ
jgi:hypothetical protein